MNINNNNDKDILNRKNNSMYLEKKTMSSFLPQKISQCSFSGSNMQTSTSDEVIIQNAMDTINKVSKKFPEIFLSEEEQQKLKKEQELKQKKALNATFSIAGIIGTSMIATFASIALIAKNRVKIDSSLFNTDSNTFWGKTADWCVTKFDSVMNKIDPNNYLKVWDSNDINNATYIKNIRNEFQNFQKLCDDDKCDLKTLFSKFYEIGSKVKNWSIGDINFSDNTSKKWVQYLQDDLLKNIKYDCQYIENKTNQTLYSKNTKYINATRDLLTTDYNDTSYKEYCKTLNKILDLIETHPKIKDKMLNYENGIRPHFYELDKTDFYIFNKKSLSDFNNETDFQNKKNEFEQILNQITDSDSFENNKTKLNKQIQNIFGEEKNTATDELLSEIKILQDNKQQSLAKLENIKTVDTNEFNKTSIKTIEDNLSLKNEDSEKSLFDDYLSKLNDIKQDQYKDKTKYETNLNSLVSNFNSYLNQLKEYSKRLIDVDYNNNLDSLKNSYKNDLFKNKNKIILAQLKTKYKAENTEIKNLIQTIEENNKIEDSSYLYNAIEYYDKAINNNNNPVFKNIAKIFEGCSTDVKNNDNKNLIDKLQSIYLIEACNDEKTADLLVKSINSSTPYQKICYQRAALAKKQEVRQEYENLAEGLSNEKNNQYYKNYAQMINLDAKYGQTNISSDFATKAQSFFNDPLLKQNIYSVLTKKTNGDVKYFWEGLTNKKPQIQSIYQKMAIIQSSTDCNKMTLDNKKLLSSEDNKEHIIDLYQKLINNINQNNILSSRNAKKMENNLHNILNDEINLIADAPENYLYVSDQTFQDTLNLITNFNNNYGTIISCYNDIEKLDKESKETIYKFNKEAFNNFNRAKNKANEKAKYFEKAFDYYKKSQNPSALNKFSEKIKNREHNLFQEMSELYLNKAEEINVNIEKIDNIQIIDDNSNHLNKQLSLYKKLESSENKNAQELYAFAIDKNSDSVTIDDDIKFDKNCSCLVEAADFIENNNNYKNKLEYKNALNCYSRDKKTQGDYYKGLLNAYTQEDTNYYSMLLNNKTEEAAKLKFHNQINSLFAPQDQSLKFMALSNSAKTLYDNNKIDEAKLLYGILNDLTSDNKDLISFHKNKTLKEYYDGSDNIENIVKDLNDNDKKEHNKICISILKSYNSDNKEIKKLVTKSKQYMNEDSNTNKDKLIIITELITLHNKLSSEKKQLEKIKGQNQALEGSYNSTIKKISDRINDLQTELNK